MYKTTFKEVQEACFGVSRALDDAIKFPVCNTDRVFATKFRIAMNVLVRCPVQDDPVSKTIPAKKESSEPKRTSVEKKSMKKVVVKKKASGPMVVKEKIDEN